MTPREELLENIVDIVYAHDGNMGNIIKLIEATLKTHYAISKWVPVSERLPNKAWEGLVIMDDEQAIAEFEPPEPGIEHCWRAYDQGIYDDSITHWLELDMPEVES